MARQGDGGHGVQPVATGGFGRLEGGRNAVDAAIACALAGVVDGHNSGIGGGCFDPEARRWAAVGVGRTGNRAGSGNAGHVPAGWKADPALSVDGALAVGVPVNPP